MPRKKQQISLGDQVKLLYGNGAWHFNGVPSLGLEPISLHDGPCGLRIPNGGEDALDISSSRPAICFPAPCATASSWDVSLLDSLGVMMGKECASEEVNVLLSPGVNIKRNPLCGRNFEYFSEDPLLAGKMGAAFVRGIQSQNVGACVKHFVANNQESHRMVNDSIVDQRALHEIYLKPFEIVVKESSPWTLMSSYNKINGIYASDHDELLVDTLKKEWGFDGVVMSDWGGCADPILSHNHGLDVEMPCFESRQIRMLRAITLNKLSKQSVADSAGRVVKLLRRCSKMKSASFDNSSAHDLAVKIAEKSAVLLKNDKILPLSKITNTAIIGEFARTPRIQGAGSSRVNPYRVENFLNCIQSLPSTKNILFSPGYSLKENDPVTESLILDAVDVASRSSNVILFLGLRDKEESEGYDRKDLLLPDDQIRLFDQIYSVNKNIIVVLTCGAPVELPFLDRCKALLLAYLPGEGGGRAIANLLLGRANPSGHLAETWPKRHYDVPSFGFYPGSASSSIYRESIYVGYRYYLTCGKEVAFPFGYGLSYSKFKFGDASLSKKTIKEGDATVLSVKVSNLSSVEGEAVVQAYIADPKRDVFKPKRTLCGFAKISLGPNQTKTAEIEIPYNAFAHYDIDRKAFLVEGGSYQIEIGESCLDILESVSINVKSETVFESKKRLCPVYYNPPVDGFIPFEDDFEQLLGRPLSLDKDRRSRPYNLHSTVEDIKGTWIGRKVLAAANKRIKETDEDSRELIERSILETPIRALSMGGVSSRMQAVILALANGKPFRALRHLLFGAGGNK